MSVDVLVDDARWRWLDVERALEEDDDQDLRWYVDQATLNIIAVRDRLEQRRRLAELEQLFDDVDEATA